MEVTKDCADGQFEDEPGGMSDCIDSECWYISDFLNHKNMYKVAGKVWHRTRDFDVSRRDAHVHLRLV